MVAANVQITQGAGTRMATSSYTEGGVTVHDEKVLLGETYLPTYTVCLLANISTATANSHLLQIMAGASNKVRVRRIEIYQSVMATTATILGLGIYRLSTAGTGGTAYGVNPLDPSDGAADATAMSLPTVKGTEGALLHLGGMLMMQTLGASTLLTLPGYVLDFDRRRSKPLMIAAGTANGIAVKNTAAIAGGSVNITVWLDLTTF